MEFYNTQAPPATPLLTHTFEQLDGRIADASFGVWPECWECDKLSCSVIDKQHINSLII
jgi:hypothetical protein